MTTIKSSSDNRFKSMYLASLKNQFPFAIVTGIFSLLAITVVYFSYMSRWTVYMQGWEHQEIVNYLRDSLTSGVYVSPKYSALVCAVLALIAIASAFVSHSYMHSKRRTDLYHALPVTRGQMLTANTLGSLTGILVPFTAVYLITMLGQVIFYGKYRVFTDIYFKVCAADFAAVVIYVLVVYFFSTLIAVNVGTVFDALAVTGIVGLMPTVIYYILGQMWDQLTYGARFEGNLSWILSPFLFTLQRFQYIGYDTVTGARIYEFGKMMTSTLVWLVLGILCYVAAIACYRRRKSEIAGQTQPKGVWQRIAMGFAAFCGSMLLYAIFYEANIVVQLIAMVAGAVVVGIVVAMVFARGTKRLVQNVKWLACAGGVSCLILLGISMDVVGYTGRIPQRDEVESVSISYQGRFEDISGMYRSYYSYSTSFFFNRHYYYGNASDVLTDSGAIDTILNAHERAVENPPLDMVRYGVYDEDYLYSTMAINYNLANGKTMSRYYNIMHRESMEILTALENNEDFIRNNHPIFILDGMETLPQEELVRSVYVNDSYSSKPELQHHLNKEDIRKLIDAVQQDMLAESMEEILSPTKPALGYLNFRYREAHEVSNQYGWNEDTTWYMNNNMGTYSNILITSEYTNTLRVLQELGLDSYLEQPEVDKFYVMSIYDTNPFSEGRVNITPQEYGYSYLNDLVSAYQNGNLDSWYGYGYEERMEIFETRTAAEAKNLTEAARNQIYVGEDINNNYAVIVPEIDGKQLDFKIVAIADLPASIQASFTEYNQYKKDLYRDNVTITDYSFAVETVMEEIREEFAGEYYEDEPEDISFNESSISDN